MSSRAPDGGRLPRARGGRGRRRSSHFSFMPGAGDGRAPTPGAGARTRCRRRNPRRHAPLPVSAGGSRPRKATAARRCPERGWERSAAAGPAVSAPATVRRPAAGRSTRPGSLRAWSRRRCGCPAHLPEAELPHRPLRPTFRRAGLRASRPVPGDTAACRASAWAVVGSGRRPEAGSGSGIDTERRHGADPRFVGAAGTLSSLSDDRRRSPPRAATPPPCAGSSRRASASARAGGSRPPLVGAAGRISFERRDGPPKCRSRPRPASGLRPAGTRAARRGVALAPDPGPKSGGWPGAAPA